MTDMIVSLKTVRLGTARSTLFGVWFVGAFAIFGLNFLYTFLEIYGNDAESVAAAWSWLLPTIGPTLSLISASILLHVFKADPADQNPLARPIVFYVTLLWSLGYLFIVLGAIITSANAEDLATAQATATTPLGAVQSILTGLLGAFFMTEKN